MAQSQQRGLFGDLFFLDDTDAADLALVLAHQRRRLGRIRRDNDGQPVLPVLIVEHEVQKLGQHLLRLALLQHDQSQFLVAHLRRFSLCHALPLVSRKRVSCGKVVIVGRLHQIPQRAAQSRPRRWISFASSTSKSVATWPREE